MNCLIGKEITVGGWYLSGDNQVGGTISLPDKKRRVRVIKSFYDYEVGYRFHGLLLDEKDIEESKEIGKVSKETIEYWENHPEERHEHRKDWKYNPALVYFSEHSIKNFAKYEAIEDGDY